MRFCSINHKIKYIILISTWAFYTFLLVFISTLIVTSNSFLSFTKVSFLAHNQRISIFIELIFCNFDKPNNHYSQYGGPKQISS